MNNREKNKYERLGSLGAFYNDQKSGLSGVPALDGVFTDLSSWHREIGLNIKALEGGTKGKTVSKDTSLTGLTRTVLVFTGALYGYADAAGDTELFTFADVSTRTLSKMRESEVPVYAEKVFDKADEIGAGLEPYGITADKRTAARSALNQVIEKYGDLSAGKITKQGANATIKMLIKKSDAKIKVLERLMLSFRENDPALYIKFEAANNIIDRGGSNGGTDTPPENPPAQ